MTKILYLTGLLLGFNALIHSKPDRGITKDDTKIKADDVQLPRIRRQANYQESIKAPTICDPSARQLMGPLDLPSGKKTFFWFFESRKSPLDRPVLIRVASLPDQSNFFGLNSGTWPCKIKENEKDQSTLVNQYSTNEFVNVLYIEQPGAGFSPKTENKNEVDTIVEFISEFHKKFPRYAKLGIHISSESFGSVLATKLALAMHDKKFNLKSLILGSPVLDLTTQLKEALLLVEENYQYFKVNKADINGLMPNNSTSKCIIDHNPKDCEVAASALWNFIQDKRVRMFNRIWHLETNSDAYTLRKNIVSESNEFLIRNQVQHALFGKTIPYIEKNLHALSVVPKDNHWLESCLSSLEELLQADIDLLLYSGDNDLLSHPNGLLKIVQRLSSKKRSGRPRFVRIPDAGHLASFDNPKAVQNEINDWLGLDLSES